MKYEQEVLNAATLAGITDLKVLGVTIDRTWGDLQGYAFFGSPETIERAVRHCMTFHSSVRKPGSYGAQNANGDRGIIEVWVDWKAARELGFETKYEQGQAPIKARCGDTYWIRS